LRTYYTSFEGAILETQTNNMKNTCLAVIFLGIGIVNVGYATYLTGRAANSSFGPAGSILTGTASAMYMFGVPTLIIGICLALNVYSQRGSGIRTQTGRLPDSRRTVLPAGSNVGGAVCPDCGFMLGPELGMRRPDGSVICGRCFKKFIP